ncbi:MAG: NADH-ubiquinone oxidoreductase subunit NDUFA12 family protein [Candidatus Lariskella arthropodorum]
MIDFMCIATVLYTKFFGTRVGSDEFGNVYYERSDEKNFFGRKKRWVMYSGIVEPTKVPSAWFAWLHHQRDAVPDFKEYGVKRSKGKKTHIPNLTGTQNAYYPPGYGVAPNRREKVSADYEAWEPDF